MAIKVLFICCDNAARSQMAEHILNHLGSGNFEARSAGSRPKPVHPLTIETLKQFNIDASTARSRHISEYAGEHFDYVINVCEQTRSSCDGSCRDSCPSFPGHDRKICWSFDDVANSDEADPAYAFRRICNEISNRLRIWIPVIEKSLKANRPLHLNSQEVANHETRID